MPGVLAGRDQPPGRADQPARRFAGADEAKATGAAGGQAGLGGDPARRALRDAREPPTRSSTRLPTSWAASWCSSPATRRFVPWLIRFGIRRGDRGGKRGVGAVGDLSTLLWPGTVAHGEPRPADRFVTWRLTSSFATCSACLIALADRLDWLRRARECHSRANELAHDRAVPDGQPPSQDSGPGGSRLLEEPSRPAVEPGDESGR